METDFLNYIIYLISTYKPVYFCIYFSTLKQATGFPN